MIRNLLKRIYSKTLQQYPKEDKDKNGSWYWHFYHDELVARTPHPLDRAKDIITYKPLRQIRRRLRLFKRVQDQEVIPKALGEYNHKELDRLHAKECPHCPWNGSTIFP